MGQSVLNQRQRSNMIWRFVGAFLLATVFLSFGIWNMFDSHFKIKKEDEEKEKIEAQNIKKILPLLDSLSSLAESIKLYNDDVSKIFPPVPERIDNSIPLRKAHFQIEQYMKFINTNNEVLKKDKIANVASVLEEYLNFTRKVHDLLIATNQKNSDKESKELAKQAGEAKEKANFEIQYKTLVAKLKEKDCAKKILEELEIK